VATALLSLALIGCGQPAPTDDDAPVARVGPMTITAAELLDRTRHQLVLRGEHYDALEHYPALTWRQRVLWQMVDDRVCELRADDATRQRARSRAETMFTRERGRAGTAENWARLLADAQLDEPTYRDGLYRTRLFEELAAAAGRPVPPVTEEAIRAAYDADPKRWRTPATWEVRLHYEATSSSERGPRARAACRQRALAAHTAATVAGHVAAPRVVLVEGRGAPLLDRVARETPAGRISAVFELGRGYAFLERLDERLPVPRTFAEARGEIRRTLQEQARDRHERELLAVWRREANVEFLLDYRDLPARLPLAPTTGEVFVAVAGTMVIVGMAIWRLRAEWLICGVLVAGAALRSAQWHGMPYEYSGYDVEHHLQYIGYVTEHWRVPPARLGFQFYQPPLYYFLNAAAGRLTGNPFAPRTYQTISLWLSLVTLATGLATLRLLLARERVAMLIAALVLAVHPAWVAMAGRINNDVLVIFLACTTLLCLLRWWRDDEARWWWAASVMLALGVLTKTTAWLWVPVAGFLPAMRPSLSTRERLRLGATVLALVALVAGWFIAYRVGVDGQRQFAGNLEQLSPATRMSVSAATFAPPNPVELVRQPFLQPAVPDAGMDNFWGWFLRSSLFGEFRFPQVPRWITSGLMAATLVSVIGAGIGWVARVRRDGREHLPLTVWVVVLMAGHIAYVVSAPFRVSMDFRYSAVLVLPAAYLLMATPWRWCGWLAGGACVLLVLAFHIFALPM
jgi:4-amino-4-deoxy-L-arabinose transferase-like glycosyltransferase